jgi:hypothetical protein
MLTVEEVFLYKIKFFKLNFFIFYVGYVRSDTAPQILEQHNLTRESVLHRQFLNIQRERLKAAQPKPVQSKRAISKINNDYRNQAHNSTTTFRLNKKSKTE